MQAIAAAGGIAIAADLDATAAAAQTGSLPNGGSIEGMQLDITDANSVQGLFDTLHCRFGRVDGVVNNAYPRNTRYGRKLNDVEYADFCDNVGRHLGGYFLVAQRACRQFVRQGGGVLVNMSSIYGSLTPRFEIYEGTEMTMPIEYAAIKSGVEHMTRYFARYFKGSGIRVNTLSPGGILAGQPPSFLSAYRNFCSSTGMLDATDLCGPLLFLLSDESRHIQGQNLIVDDGFSL